MPLRTSTLTTFDGTWHETCSVARPEKIRELREILQVGNTPLIARGAGLSYSPASFGSESVVIEMHLFDRILALDYERLRVTVEPGISVGKLSEFLLREGMLLPVVPGYPAITVGGCVACDVHGKSQFHSGNFGDKVLSLRLEHPALGVVDCSRETNAELFHLTIGGLGLTGLITRVEIQLLRRPGTQLHVESIPVANLHQAADVLEASAAAFDGVYSWHNCNTRMDGFGQGLVFREKYVDGPPVPPSEPVGRMSVWRRAPFSLWKGPFTSLALWGYKTMAQRNASRVLPVRRGLFPIEGLEFYYAAFGRVGFREYQVIVPRHRWDAYVEEFRKILDAAQLPVTLASLKLFRGAPRRVSFVGEGICLALDVPESQRARQLFVALDELSVRHSAPVNLAKDGRVPPAVCAKVFSGYGAFCEALKHFDSSRRFRSALRSQLNA